MSNAPRVGIERKILTSILWVGIFPMTIMVILGYVIARGGQGNAVQQTLLTASRKTAEGIQLVAMSRLQEATKLATDPDVVRAINAHGAGRGPQDSDGHVASALLSRFRRQTADGEDAFLTIAIYDRTGNRVLATNTDFAAERLTPAMIVDLPEARFRNFGAAASLNGYWALIVVPVIAPETGEGVGYLTLRTGISSLLLFALGDSLVEENDSSRSDVYQLVLVASEGAMLLTQLEQMPGSETRQLVSRALDPALQTVLKQRPSSGSRMFNSYTINNDSEKADVLLAFYRVADAGFDLQDVYLVVFRPSTAVFSQINVWAILALVVCVFVIALLCVNAYRDVHNNIVRPVSLLNEGAQIIRQGDFDLKLKIETGDEIEELAQSFNKMAVALKANMTQLEESEEKYRTLVTSMQEGIYRTDPEGEITFINPSGAAILGFGTAERAIGSNLQDLYLEETNLDPFAEDGALEDSDERSRIWMKRRDRKTICVELSRNPIHDSIGVLIGFEGMFRDITKNVRLEEEARERAERISAINQIANVINSSLEAGRLYESLAVELRKLVDFDYAAVALLAEAGTSFDARQLWPDYEVGLGYTYILDGEHSSAAWVSRERKHLRINEMHDARSPFAAEFPDDTQSCLCVPLYATGRIIGTLNLGSRRTSAFTARDVESIEQMAPHTAVAIRNAQLLVNLQLSLEEVTRAREKLHIANEELKTLDEMKTNLLSNVSHELRTPLVSVMGYTDMIFNGKAGPINNTQREYLEISLRNIEKLVTLIENLLDFSRLHRGDERLVFDSFDLVDCARASIEIVKPVADSREISLTLDPDESPILVEGDLSKMGQVFTNLLSNAVKFNSKGGLVQVDMKIANGNVDVSVTDTGIGIPSEALDKVFTRFYQYDGSSTRKYGGTGIGLSIAQDIVRLHGSSISVSSKQGTGSIFRFELPLAHAPAPTEESAEDLPIAISTHAHMLIELVTQDRALSAQVRNLLLSEGIDMIHALSSENAAALAQKHSPDCLIVDMNLSTNGHPQLDELLKDVSTREMPIIILTNDYDVYERYRSFVVAWVKRSFRKSTLLSGIHHALSGQADIIEPTGDKVLCIDDDPEILTFMARCLEAEGFSTDTCESGEEAVEKVDSGEYGLILLDISMPGMDGWETCRRVRAKVGPGGVKIYMVTAKPIEQNMSRVQECGADGFLLKPFRPEDLVQLVQGLQIGGAVG